jgi:hypothetical protein
MANIDRDPNSATHAGRREPYATPKITKVRMEDRQTVAMAVCKESLESDGCAKDLQPTFNFNPS